MDRKRCEDILVAYGVGPNTMRLICYFWDHAELVCRASGQYRVPFRAERGVTQGRPLSPKLFNFVVDAIFREWLRQVVGDEAAKSGVGEAVQGMLPCFYADDGAVCDRQHRRLQQSTNILVELFDCAGLRTNTAKTEAMTCVPGKIRTRLTTEAYNNSRTGLQSTAEWNKCQ
eukprot:12270982-Ditylum_brightwellii.AAC.1